MGVWKLMNFTHAIGKTNKSWSFITMWNITFAEYKRNNFYRGVTKSIICHRLNCEQGILGVVAVVKVFGETNAVVK